MHLRLENKSEIRVRIHQIHIVCFYTKCTLFANMHALLGRPRVVSRSFGCGARRRPACTRRRKCRSPPSSVACAPGVQSRAIWQVITGSQSASPSLAGQWKSHNAVFLLCCCCIMPSASHRPSSFQALLCGRHCPTAVAHQALLFVTATDTASVCVWVLAPCFLWTKKKEPAHKSREVQLIGCCVGGRTISTHNSSGIE